MSELANNGMAELVEKYSNLFPVFIASLPLNKLDEAVKEARGAIEKLEICWVLDALMRRVHYSLPFQ